MRIHLPPLRERLDDVPALAMAFLAEAARTLGLPAKRFSTDALTLLSAHQWPGNVRELRNLCTRLAVMAPGAQVLPSDLRSALQAAERRAPGNDDWLASLQRWARQQLAEGRKSLLSDAREQLESSLIDLALEQTEGDRQQAARLLGCGRNTLTRKLGPKRS